MTLDQDSLPTPDCFSHIVIFEGLYNHRTVPAISNKRVVNMIDVRRDRDMQIKTPQSFVYCCGSKSRILKLILHEFNEVIAAKLTLNDFARSQQIILRDKILDLLDYLFLTGPKPLGTS